MRSGFKMIVPKIFAMALAVAGVAFAAAPKQAEAAPIAVSTQVASPEAGATEAAYGSGHGRFVGHHRRHMRGHHHRMHRHHYRRGHHHHHHHRMHRHHR
ncbi:hypothetical protein [Methylobacterium soli]|nr:hypothetical protein [Methylobacterium soli]GJE46240.1 hypothetical protein AEGHOMDF_5441 [Methylobacterium soli]